MTRNRNKGSTPFAWSVAMTAIQGSAAAVTGAASGIGRALALELAARGCDLAMADRDEAGLQAVAAEIAKANPRKVTVHRVDVGELGQIQEFAVAATAAHPGLNLLINNAGVALLGQFGEVEQAQMEWLININFWGVVHATRAFLPQLSRQSAAHIVNLSSIFGIIAPPGQTAYCAAKFAVRGFSGKPAARAGDGEQSGKTVRRASRRRCHQHR